MKKIELSLDRLAKIREFNEICRLKLLMESVNPRPIEENIVVNYNGKLIDMPKRYAKKS